jgi:hypothetical protein
VKRDTFLSCPSETTLEGMSRGHPDECWNAVGSSNARLQTVNNLVASGNREAALYLASNLKRLDGGNLEDALVALGHFAELTMAPLLEFARNQVLTNAELSDALTMLPLSSSDDPGVQLAEMEKRRAAVGRVTDRRLTEQKVLALAAIDSFIIEIKRSINHWADEP